MTESDQPASVEATTWQQLREASLFLASRRGVDVVDDRSDISTGRQIATSGETRGGITRWVEALVGDRRVVVESKNDDELSKRRATTPSRRVVDDFVAELRVAIELLRLKKSHPNVCSLRAVYDDDETTSHRPFSSVPRFVFARFEGVALSTWATASPKKTAVQVRGVLVQLLSAVVHLHRNASMVHGNLSMEDAAVVAQNGTVTLIDLKNAFKTSRVCGLDSRLRRCRYPPCATSVDPNYAAPEVLCGRRCDPEAAETHAVGAIALCLAARTAGGFRAVLDATHRSPEGWRETGQTAPRTRSRATTALATFWGKSKTLRFWSEWEKETRSREGDEPSSPPFARYERAVVAAPAWKMPSSPPRLGRDGDAFLFQEDGDRRIAALSLRLIQPLPGHRRSASWMKRELVREREASERDSIVASEPVQRRLLRQRKENKD